MPSSRNRNLTLICASILSLFAVPAVAALPSSQLLPESTKGYLSIPDIERLEKDFNRIQLGELMADPIMEPFAEDFKRQLRDKWTAAHDPLALTWDDLREVPTGEVAMARLQPTLNTAAAVIIADVEGNLDGVDKLLAKVEKNMAERKSTREVTRVGDVELITYTHTQGKDNGASAVYFMQPDHNQLVIADDIDVAKMILARFEGQHDDSLAELEAFQVVMQRVTAAQGDLTPHARWFVEPFGFVEARRIANPDSGPKKKKDLFAALKNQGFTAVQGVGGLVTLAEGDHDIEHRTMVYAPAVKRSPNDANRDKYDLAMRMLNFYNRANHAPPAWVPRDLASYASLNADLRNGFEYSKTLVNELADDKIFEDVLRSLKDDPAGPRVDIRKEIVANLGEHVMVLTDYALPITPDSERMLICIELSNVAPAVAALNKIMENDPNAVQRRVGKNIIWEVVEEDDVDVPEFEFEFEFEQFEIPEDQVAAEEEDKSLPTSAVTVAHGYLMVATHIEQIYKVLGEIEKRKTMAGSIDYQIVIEELEKLGAGEDSVRYFSRTDEEYRATYELVKQGKMPEANTMTGRLLNFVFDDDNDDETVRKQQIDGSKLPDYQRVRRYLGPAGIYAISVEDGWLITGILLRSL